MFIPSQKCNPRDIHGATYLIMYLFCRSDRMIGRGQQYTTNMTRNPCIQGALGKSHQFYIRQMRKKTLGEKSTENDKIIKLADQYLLKWIFRVN